MTKSRAPLSYDLALAKIAALIGWEAMAAVTGRKERTVRNWGDPDTGESCPIDCAELLDIAYLAAGGDGQPMAETMVSRLERARHARFADNIALSRQTELLVKEGGEAFAALIAATREGSSLREIAAAERETQEMIEAGTAALAKLAAMKRDQRS